VVANVKFVVSNKSPEYKKEELHLRALRNSCEETIKELIAAYEANNNSYGDFDDLASTQK